ncbi:zinc metalloprotease [Cyclospora cayetanensis]|uniref:Zinc metalloprotease n=1 Tax=Cyclospora cayetanensis TaxID=88456 RepID=A0A1D3D840_9EIME|nr:zinc metalloprotease [Cyclospora cayetanensis]
MASSGSSLRGQDFVVAASISTHHLWKKVREIGGAYGAGFVFDASGLFCFTSFRDPQLVKTLRAYKETPAFLRKWAASMTESDVRRAIIAVLRDLDAPLPSDQKGTKSLWQLIARQTEAHRRQFRKEILSTTPADFVSFAERLEEALLSEQGQHVAVVGSEDACNEAEKSDPSLSLKVIDVFNENASKTNSRGMQNDTQVISA